MKKKGKGWMRVGQFPNAESAQKRQASITAQGFDFAVEKGTKGSAWGKPHEVHRLWARDRKRR